MDNSEITSPEVTIEQKERKGPWGFWSTAGLGCAVSLIFIATQILVALIYTVVKLASVFPSDVLEFTQALIADGLLISLATIIGGAVGSVLIFLFIKIRGSYSLVEYLGFRRITRKSVIVLVAVSAGISLASALFASLFDQVTDAGVLTEAYISTGWTPLFWLAVVIMAPVFEEIFFRGFLFTGFERSRIGVSGTIALTTIIWTFLHVGQYGAYGLVTIFAMGIVLGVARYKTGSIWSPLIMHAFFNLLAVIEVAYTASLL